ncbi:hypothetical protein [Tomitella fengzijianii]|uniref:hypothetical protein n=1 Tax=Tomitella fengzijianii TaxID=2597660 RepID=UPI00131CE7E8|nr:hypothetical protein [Tomitella fengzijianii]
MHSTGHSAPVDAAGVPVDSPRFADPGPVSWFYVVTALAAVLLPLVALGLCFPAQGVATLWFLALTASVWVPGYLLVLWIAFRLVQTRNAGPRFFHRAPRPMKSVTAAGLWVMGLAAVLCAFIMPHAGYAGTDAHSLAEFVGFGRLHSMELFSSVGGIGVCGGLGLAVAGYMCAILAGSQAQGRARTEALRAHEEALHVDSPNPWANSQWRS